MGNGDYAGFFFNLDSISWLKWGLSNITSISDYIGNGDYVELFEKIQYFCNRHLVGLA